MGIDVSSKKAVTLNDNHERGLVTKIGTPGYNFKIQGGVYVQCVFRRSWHGRDHNDGIPLMYALKNRRGFTVDSSQAVNFYRRGRPIVRSLIPTGCFDVIIPAPSSAGVALYLAKRINRFTGQNAVLADIFLKQTVGQVLQAAVPPDTYPGSTTIRRAYREAFERLQKLDSNSAVEIKNIDKKVRGVFEPIIIIPSAKIPHGKRVLIVDDSASTGTTLEKCATLIRRYFRPSQIVGIVIVGPQGNL